MTTALIETSELQKHQVSPRFWSFLTYILSSRLLTTIRLSLLLNSGISGSVLSWFRSYLTERSFKVSSQGRMSSFHHLSTGVPQGSVFGPLLFTIYTTSLCHVIRPQGFSYYCFADDTQLYSSFPPDDPTISAHVSVYLSDLSAWMEEHHLQLNLSKAEVLVIPVHH